MIKVIRQSEAVVRQITGTYKATNFITKDVSPNVSLAVNEAVKHSETETTDYDRIYYVLDGELHIRLKDNDYTVYAGDACFISAHTTYDFSGSFKAVVVNQPAFGSKA